LLRLQYWFDRLSEPRRLLVGLACIAFLGACVLYVLGISSTLLLIQDQQAPQAEELALSADLQPPEVAATLAPIAGPPMLPPEPTPLPTVERNDRLIAPPDVPEVPVVAVPRYVEPAPVATLKPRAVAPPPEAAQAAPEPARAPARAVVVAPATATSAPAPVNPVPAAPKVKPAAPPAQPAAPPAQPAVPRLQPTALPRIVPTPTRPPAPPVLAPTRAVVSTPAAPTVAPRAGNGPAVPRLVQTPTTRRAPGP
jgi:hypothetical protein